MNTCCFLAASLLSSFTRDSDLEGEPPLADTILVVLENHIFTLSAGQNFMMFVNFGFGSVALFPLLLWTVGVGGSWKLWR